ncbi:hypothetical protein MSIBF_A1990007 [groundwater metagenome]|uniref:Uncharacterized protein n=1 Tax=groundwater metagenome TaxID=717931 RepID=A0A098E815_9ZZZZ
MDKKRDSKRGNGAGRKKETLCTDNTRREDKNDKVKRDEGKNDKVKRDRDKNDKDNEDEVIVIVNGKRLPMGNFPKKIIKEVVVAMVYSLRGGEGAEEIEINIKR